MKTVCIPGEAPYRVLIGEGLLRKLGEELRAVHVPCRAAVVTDSDVAPLYLAQALAALRGAGFEPVHFVFPAGEASKTAETWLSIQRFLIRSGLTRADLLVALGGGVTGDLAGFAAATYQRGIPFVQVPTTLLGAVDASVGGKTGVDLPEGKNLVGAFHQPLLVVCDTDTFATLPERCLRDGAAEMLKHGVLADADLFEKVASGRWRDDLPALVQRNVEIKCGFVAGDERDRGRRQLLNFGHTVGHALEVLSGYTLSHGEAVAVGMAAETRAARKMGLTNLSETIILKGAEANGLPAACGFSFAEVYQAALRDKKRTDERITVCVPLRLGEAALHSLSLDAFADYLEKGLTA